MNKGTAAWLQAAPLAAVFVLFFLVPLALIVLYPFSAEDKSYVFPPPALTTQWFGVAWARDDVWAAITLILRFCSSLSLLNRPCPPSGLRSLNKGGACRFGTLP